MNLHLAISWILRNWNNKVTNMTIYNCFWKSTLVSSPILLSTPIILLGIADLYRRVTEAGNIHNVMAIANFLNPTDKMEGEDSDEDIVGGEEILQEVIQEHLGVPCTQDNNEDEQLAQPVYTASDALKAAQVLIGYTESQESLSTEYLQVLERLESGIEGIRQASLVQHTIDS
jgi:hypothetical protein